MEVSVEVHKLIMWTIYLVAFYTSGGGVAEVLVGLLLVAKIIKDANLMYI